MVLSALLPYANIVTILLHTVFSIYICHVFTKYDFDTCIDITLTW